MSWFGRDCGQVGSVVKSSGALGHPGRCQALSSHGRSRCQVIHFWVRYAVMSLLLLVVKSKSLGRVALVSWFGRDCGQVGSVVKSSGALDHPGRCEALSELPPNCRLQGRELRPARGLSRGPRGNARQLIAHLDTHQLKAELRAVLWGHPHNKMKAEFPPGLNQTGGKFTFI